MRTTNLAQTFYNGFLPEITDNEHMGRVSALGYSFGYAGQYISLMICLSLIRLWRCLGLPEADGFRHRISLMLVGIWWAIFSLPLLLIVRDRSPLAPAPVGRDVGRCASRSGGGSSHDSPYSLLSNAFDVSAWFSHFQRWRSNLFSQTSVFAEKVLHLRIDKLALVVLMIQFIALPGACILVGRLADRIGQKAAHESMLGRLGAVLSGAFFISEEWHFWIMAAATALVLGGTQSVSRTIVGLMTPESAAANSLDSSITWKGLRRRWPDLFQRDIGSHRQPPLGHFGLAVVLYRGLGGYPSGRRWGGSA